MNLQDKLVEILTQIQSGVKAAGDFAMEQLPEIAQTYVAYGRILSTTKILLCVSVMIVVITAVVVIYKRTKSLDCLILSSVFGAAISIAPIVGFFYELSNFFLVWVAPKVWLLKEIAELIK